MVGGAGALGTPHQSWRKRSSVKSMRWPQQDTSKHTRLIKIGNMSKGGDILVVSLCWWMEHAVRDFQSLISENPPWRHAKTNRWTRAVCCLFLPVVLFISTACVVYFYRLCCLFLSGRGVLFSRRPPSVSGGIPATEPLRRGLNELSDVCQHVLNTFQVSPRVRHWPPGGSASIHWKRVQVEYSPNRDLSGLQKTHKHTFSVKLRPKECVCQLICNESVRTPPSWVSCSAGWRLVLFPSGPSGGDFSLIHTWNDNISMCVWWKRKKPRAVCLALDISRPMKGKPLPAPCRLFLLWLQRSFFLFQARVDEFKERQEQPMEWRAWRAFDCEDARHGSHKQTKDVWPFLCIHRHTFSHTHTHTHTHRHVWKFWK